MNVLLVSEEAADLLVRAVDHGKVDVAFGLSAVLLKGTHLAGTLLASSLKCNNLREVLIEHPLLKAGAWLVWLIGRFDPVL